MRSSVSVMIFWSKHTFKALYRNMLLLLYAINYLECVFIFSKVMLMFRTIRACAGLKMVRRLTCTHSLLMGMRAATQSHRQPVKLFEGRTNVIPQLYQSHRWALGIITDQEEKTGKQEGDCSCNIMSLYICDIGLWSAAVKEKYKSYGRGQS